MNGKITRYLLMITAIALLVASGIHLAAVATDGHPYFLVLAAIEGVGGAYLRILAARI